MQSKEPDGPPIPTMDEKQIYRRIGELAVSFQWIENLVRQIGWFILDPQRKNWPPRKLTKEDNGELVNKVTRLFLEALPKCSLGADLEEQFRAEFMFAVGKLHELRNARNRILHSAYIELKAGGEFQGLLGSNPRLLRNSETGVDTSDQELLSEESFEKEFELMAYLATFLTGCHTQLTHRFSQAKTRVDPNHPTGGGWPTTT